MSLNTNSANCLNAGNTPIYSSGTLPTGTIFACNLVPYPGRALPLYIVI